MSSNLNIYEKLLDIVHDNFVRHPFAEITNIEQLKAVLPDFLAMSIAFRYLQAAAQKKAIFEVINNNTDVPYEIELTNAVANFLSWDESGGCELILKHGKSGLPKILDTPEWFHSNILRKDIRKILGYSVTPNFGQMTRQYLTQLYDGLSSTDAVKRCAYMVAFEAHASLMIERLGFSIVSITDRPLDDFQYFNLHIGGSDPAEKYHVQMTQLLIDRVVHPLQQEHFQSEFQRAFLLNCEWCNKVLRQSTTICVSESDSEVWHKGSCHCGGIEFKVQASPMLKAILCNCSICEKSGFLHLLVPAERFLLISGSELLTTYQFNQRIAKHTFCRVCGIKPFYRPRSNPNGYSINVHCLDRATILSVSVSEFNGQHWEESISELNHKV